MKPSNYTGASIVISNNIIQIKFVKQEHKKEDDVLKVCKCPDCNRQYSTSAFTFNGKLI